MIASVPHSWPLFSTSQKVTSCLLKILWYLALWSFPLSQFLPSSLTTVKDFSLNLSLSILPLKMEIWASQLVMKVFHFSPCFMCYSYPSISLALAGISLPDFSTLSFLWLFLAFIWSSLILDASVTPLHIPQVLSSLFLSHY